MTGGKDATAILIEYLVRLGGKKGGQNLENFKTNLGVEFREVSYNHQLYELSRSTVGLRGRQSIQGSRKNVARDWQLRRQENVEQCLSTGRSTRRGCDLQEPPFCTLRE